MKNFKEHLEIETLKALSYEQINKLLNDLNTKNRELTEQLRLCGVSQQRELLKAFAEQWNRNGSQLINNAHIGNFLDSL